MLSFEFIVFGVILYVLSLLTGMMFFTSEQETKVTRVGFLIVAVGFGLYATGLYLLAEVTRAIATFVIGSGIITCGIGYQDKVPKVLHIIMGLVIYGVLITRFVI